MDNEKKFLEEYQKFLEDIKQGNIDGQQVGKVVVRMANYFAIANGVYGEALIAYNAVASSIEQTIDEKGKTISSAKAKILSAATPESNNLIRAKVDIESISEIINAMKALMRTFSQEQGTANVA